MRIVPRDTACANDCSITGHVLPWLTELRYLGVITVRSRNFKCSLDAAKRSFYRAANAIFVKVGRIASEDVTLQLLSSKCIPLLLVLVLLLLLLYYYYCCLLPCDGE